MLLGKKKNPCVLALKYTPIMSLTDITDLREIQMPKFCSCLLCQSLLCEVLLGLLFSTLKRQKIAHLPRAEPKPLGDGKFYIEPKNCCLAS